MWTVRAVRIDDLDKLETLIRSATRGLTTLQLDRAQLLDRVEQSVFAFSRTGQSTKDEPYVLVLANDESGELVGTSTIYAKTGGHQAFYSYRLVTKECSSKTLNVSHARTSLAMNRVHDGPTEIGSLFLRGTYRGQGHGRWLSLSRFTVIAARRDRFASRVIAEMRGKAEADGRVPFWDAVSGRFIPVEFAVADAMSTVSKEFIEELMPEHPIYLDLLPPEVRESIGEVHIETQPALAMLQNQGFRKTDEVDIFDAGPVVSCATDEIAAVKGSRICRIDQVNDEKQTPNEKPNAIVASTQYGFTSLVLNVNSDALAVSTSAAEVLGVDVGSQVWVTSLHQ